MKRKIKRVVMMLSCLMMIFSILTYHVMGNAFDYVSTIQSSQFKEANHLIALQSTTDTTKKNVISFAEEITEPQVISGDIVVDSFETLKEAVKQGGTIYITKDIEVKEVLEIKKPTKITSKNGTHTLTRGDHYMGALVDVESDSLTIENIVIDGGYEDKKEADAALVLVSSGELFIKDGAIIQNNYNHNTSTGSCGGGIFAAKDTKVVMLGGSILNNKATRGGGVYNTEATSFIIVDGVISKNEATRGGGVYTTKSNFILLGGEISNNKSYYSFELAKENANSDAIAYGGGIFNYIGDVKLLGGKISNNEATSYQDNLLENQQVAGIGGGIASNGGTIQINGSTINHNIATPGQAGKVVTYSFGGGIATWGKTNITFENGTISNNEADYGGGIYVGGKDTFFNMNGGKVEKNLAHHQGGGMYVWQDGTINILAGYIVYNECDATPTLDHSNFGAGGIMVEEGGNLFLGKTVITENTSIDTGETPIKDPYIEKNGAAIAGCPTSDITINSNNFAIYDNAEGNNVEVSVATEHGGELLVSDTMLGGGEFNWEGTAPDYVFMKNQQNLRAAAEEENSYLTTNPKEQDKVLANQNAQVYIMNNKTSAAGGGAAIGTNGHISSYQHVIIEKEIAEGAEANPNALYTFHIYFWKSYYSSSPIDQANYILTAAKGSSLKGNVEGKQSAKGTVDLTEKTLNLANGRTLQVGEATFQLAAGEKVEFYGANYDSYSQDYYWTDYSWDSIDFYVEEELLDGWTVNWKRELVAVSYDDVLSLKRVDVKFTAVNTPVGNLTIEKKVLHDISASEVFHFTVDFRNADGSPYTKPIVYTLSGGNGTVTPGTPVEDEDDSRFSTLQPKLEGDIVYPDESGEVTFTLSKDQQVTFENLPMNTHYQLTEESMPNSDWLGVVWSTTGDTNQTNLTNNSGVIGSQPNSSVKWTATNRKSGTLIVSKRVGDSTPNRDQTFEFKVTLSDKDLNGIYGEMEFINGVATFTLKDGESKIATGLAAGLEYQVEEIDSHGYESTSTGATGTISADVVSRAEFVNKTPVDKEEDKDHEDNPEENENTKPGNPNTLDSLFLYFRFLIFGILIVSMACLYKYRYSK